jgi:long-subunit fatty acid transport protein
MTIRLKLPSALLLNERFTMSHTFGGGLKALAVLLAFGAAPLSAQVDAESFAKLGFNFSPPGAQSAALGGAYIALAKDATAAETNPAGLTVLLDPEVAFEYKAVEYTRELPFEAGGGEFIDQVAHPSFFSVVIPTGSVTLAAFRHELVNYRSTVWSEGFDRGGGVHLNPFTSVLDMRVVNTGGSLAIQATPSFSIGLSGGVSQMDLLVDFPRYRIGTFTDEFLKNRLSVNDKFNGFFLNAGVLLQLGEKVTLGGVYKLRGEFADVPFELTEFDAGGGQATRTATKVLNIPDAAGAGIAIRASDQFTISVDAVYNMYSQLAEDVAVVFSTASPTDYTADDGMDVHAGAELLLFLGQTPLALRAGVARLAPSNTYYVGSNSVEAGLWGSTANDPQTQLSGGIGLVLGRRIGFDGAFTVGDQVTQGVGSVQIFLGGG